VCTEEKKEVFMCNEREGGGKKRESEREVKKAKERQRE